MNVVSEEVEVDAVVDEVDATVVVVVGVVVVVVVVVVEGSVIEVDLDQSIKCCKTNILT